MDFLNQFANAGKEISKLQAKAREIDPLKKEISELNKKIEEEKQIWDSILPFVCPEEIERIIELSKKEGTSIFDEDKIKFAKEYLRKPKALGYIIFRTYEDTGADSGGDESVYDMYLLFNNGNVVHVCRLGLYKGNLSNHVPSAKETIIRKFFHEIKDVAKEAPICLHYVNRLI